MKKHRLAREFVGSFRYPSRHVSSQQKRHLFGGWFDSSTKMYARNSLAVSFKET